MVSTQARGRGGSCRIVIPSMEVVTMVKMTISMVRMMRKAIKIILIIVRMIRKAVRIVMWKIKVNYMMASGWPSKWEVAICHQACRPAGHVVHRGMLSTRACSQPGMLSTGAFSLRGHVVHRGMSSTRAF